MSNQLTLQHMQTTYLGKHIKTICPNKLHANTFWHCAHFVCHVMEMGWFGYTCVHQAGGAGKAANIKVHQVFAECPQVGAWASRPATMRRCLVFITRASVVSMLRRAASAFSVRHS